MSALWEYEFYDFDRKESVFEFRSGVKITKDELLKMRILKPRKYAVVETSDPTILAYPDYFRVLVSVKEQTPEKIEAFD